MGTLTLGAGVALPDGPGKGNVVFDTSTDFSSVYPAKLDMNGNDESINGLVGGLSFYSFVTNSSGTHTLTLGSADATAEFDGVISGGINLVKVGSGTETFTSADTYTGSTTVNGGALVFSGTAAIGGSGKNVTIANGALLAAPATTVSQTFLNRLITASSGVMALTTSETDNLDFSSSGANLPNVSLGAVGSVTYGGMLTPSGTTYQLGGGGGTFTITSPLTGSRSLVIGGIGNSANAAGTVVLADTNTYTGGTTVSAGALQFNSALAIGGSAASVFVAAGAVAAAGYPIDQAFLARIAPSSSGAVALAANSANNLDFSSSGANLPFVSIGAVGAATYSGVLTPAGSGYRFGGGGGALSINNAAALAGTYSVTVGLGSALPAAAANPLTLNVTAAQSYSGSTTLRAGGTLAGTLANGGLPSALGASSNVASNLVFDGGALVFTGNTDRLFTLTANGGTITTGGAYGFTNSGPIVLPSGTSVTLTLNGSDTNHDGMSPAMSNPPGGTLAIVKNGSGKWTFNVSGNKTYSGDTHVMAGTLEELASNAFSANSNMVIDAGASLELHDNSATVNGLSGAGSVFDSFASHARTLTLGAAGGNGTFTGSIPASTLLSLVKTGTGTQSLGGTTTLGQVTVGPTVGDTAVLTIPAGGLLNAGATSAPSLQVATVSGGTGTLNLSGGMLTTASELWISTTNGAHGVVNMTGGAAQIGSWLSVGRGGNDGTLNVSGGSLVVLTNYLTLASFAGNRGTLNVSGGTVNAVNSINVGESGTGSMTLSGSGLAISNATLYLGKNAGSSGTLQLNGGTLSAPGITSGGTGTVYFNGGTLVASASSGTFLNVAGAYVQSGGAAINGNGNTITVAQPLLHYSAGTAADGGLSIANGALILVRTNTYTGLTSISDGTLQLGAGQFGQDGSIADTVGILDNAALVYDLAGSQSASYPVDGSGSVTILGAGTLTLSGTNDYLGGTTVASGTLILTNNEAIADGTSLTVGDTSFLAAPSISGPSASAVSAVPEPDTLTLLAVGVIMAVLSVWRCEGGHLCVWLRSLWSRIRQVQIPDWRSGFLFLRSPNTVHE
jgi:autotransporter-associated beta strand protein